MYPRFCLHMFLGRQAVFGKTRKQSLSYILFNFTLKTSIGDTKPYILSIEQAQY